MNVSSFFLWFIILDEKIVCIEQPILTERKGARKISSSAEFPNLTHDSDSLPILEF